MSKKKNKKKKKKNKFISLPLLLILILISFLAAYLLNQKNNNKIVKSKAIIKHKQNLIVPKKKYSPAKNKFAAKTNKEKIVKSPAKTIKKNISPELKKNAKINNEVRNKLLNLNIKKSTISNSKIAIIIDDFGWDKNVVSQFTSLNIPLTLAIIPELKYSNYVGTLAHKSGKEIIVHLPMEAINHSLAGHPLKVTTTMSAAQIQSAVSKSFKDIQFAVGLNNHMGSKATSNIKTMESVMQELKNENKFFIDSNTISSSVGYSQAKKYHLKTARNDIFLDNSLQEKDMQKQFLAALALANKNGSVIIIGHAHPETANFLKKIIPELKKQGVEFVFSSQVVN